jgi:hypothetical protein
MAMRQDGDAAKCGRIAAFFYDTQNVLTHDAT